MALPGALVLSLLERLWEAGLSCHSGPRSSAHVGWASCRGCSWFFNSQVQSDASPRLSSSSLYPKARGQWAHQHSLGCLRPLPSACLGRGLCSLQGDFLTSWPVPCSLRVLVPPKKSCAWVKGSQWKSFLQILNEYSHSSENQGAGHLEGMFSCEKWSDNKQRQGTNILSSVNTGCFCRKFVISMLPFLRKK